MDLYKDLIKNTQDDYESERETNLSAVIACLSLEGTVSSALLFIIIPLTFVIIFNRKQAYQLQEMIAMNYHTMKRFVYWVRVNTLRLKRNCVKLRVFVANPWRKMEQLKKKLKTNCLLSSKIFSPEHLLVCLF